MARGDSAHRELFSFQKSELGKGENPMRRYRDFENATIPEQFVEKNRIAARNEKLRLYTPLIVLIVLNIVGWILAGDRNFISVHNFVNIMYQMSVPLVVATGITFVIMIGSTDLSLEGVIGFAAAMTSLLVTNTKNSNDFGFLALVLVLAAGALMGLLVGVTHVYLKISSFIATYAFCQVFMGVAVLQYKGIPAAIKWDVFSWIAACRPLGIPLVTWLAFGFFMIGVYILHFTAFGRGVYAIGYSEPVALSAGINVKRTKILCFMISAIAASFAGILIMVRLKQGTASSGEDQLFPAITALVVGGASVAGGKGGMGQTLLGVLITTEIANLLTIMAVNPYYKQAINAIIIIVAVSLSINRTKRTIAV